MALNAEQKRTIAELTGLGIITHQVADMLLKGALTKVETNAAIAVLKKSRTCGGSWITTGAWHRWYASNASPLYRDIRRHICRLR